MNLAEMRTAVRRDLRDEDAGSQRWTDAEIDRHIARALAELSLAAPREAVATLATTAGSRELSIAALADRASIEAVEYPAGQYPAAAVPFTTWGDTLTLLIDGTPGAADATVRYTRMHTLDGSGSTLTPALEQLIATGAAAYAALEWASYATNRVNVGGADTWRHFHVWAQERLAAFHHALSRHARERRLRARRLYAAPDGAGGAR